MITNYKNFDYNKDFNPDALVFNLNSDKRKVGIGIEQPKYNFDVVGNVSITGNLIFTGNLNYINSINNQNLSLLTVNNKGLLVYKNLVSSTTTGVEWSFSNNNNINFTLKDINDDTDLDYSTNLININNNNNIKINISNFNNLTLKYIFIVDSSNNPTNSDYNNVIIKYNGIESNIRKIANGYYELNNYINLLHNNQHIVNILNLSIVGKVQLWGNYDYQAGSMWTQNENHDLYINHNIGINTNNPKSELHINHNSIFNGNITISNNLISDYLFSNIIKTSYIDTNKIYNQNKLLINTNKNNVSINSHNNSNILNIGDHFFINDTTIQSNNIITNNLNNINSTIKIGNISSYIQPNFNNNSLNISNLIIDNESNIFFNNNIVIDKTNIIDSTNYNTDGSSLYVVGDMYIKGNMNVDNASKISLDTTIKTDNLNTNTIQVSDINVDGYSYSKNIESNKIIINKLWKIPNSIKGTYNSIYYNYKTDNFIYTDNTQEYIISTSDNENKQVNEEKNQIKLECIGSTVSKLLNSDSVNVDNVETNKFVLSNSYTQMSYNVNNLEVELLINSNLKTFDLSD